MATFIVGGDGAYTTQKHSHADGSRAELRLIGDSLLCATCGETLCGCLDSGVWVAESGEFYHLHPGTGKQLPILTSDSGYCPECLDCSPWHRDV